MTTYDSRIEEVVLVPMDEQIWAGLLFESMTVSPDGEAIAFVVALTDGQAACLARGGALTVSPRYDGIARGFVFSADGRRFAYIGMKAGRRPTHHVVIDGKEGAGYDGIATCTPLFSPDGRRVAYVASRQGKQLAVVDGEAGPEYDGIADETPTFSPDGAHFAYGVRQGGTGFLMLDGAPGPTYDRLGSVVSLGADGRRIAYVAMRTKRRLLRKATEEWFVVADGREGPAYDGIGKGTPVLSPDGSRIAYIAEARGRQFVVLDGNELESFDGVLTTPTFSPDGRRVFFICRKGGKQALVLDGKMVRAHDGMGKPVWSPDGKRWAYMAGDGGQQYVYLDDRAIGPFKAVDSISLTFSPDSRRLAFRIVSPEGESLRVADEDLPFSTYTRMTRPSFSADSRRVAFGATLGKTGFLVVDGLESSRRYDAILPSGGTPRFVANDTVQYLALSATAGYLNVREALGRGPAAL